MEERDLGGIHTGWAGLDDVVDWSGGADLSASLDLVGLNKRLQIEDGLVGEHESDLTGNLGLKGLKLLNCSTELAQLIIVRVVLLELSLTSS